MKQIVVLNDLSFAAGGASSVALTGAMMVRDAGVPVTVLAGDRGGRADFGGRAIALETMGRDRLLASSAGRAAIDGLYNRQARTFVADWIARNDTPQTVYHLHGWAQILSPAVFDALQPVRDRLVISAHDFFLVCPTGAFTFPKTGAVCELRPLGAACIAAQCDRRNYAQKLWRVARQTIQRHYYAPHRSPPVLMVHPAMRPFLERGGIPAAALRELRNPVHPFTASPVDPGLGTDLLFVGRLEQSKGADLALAAARAAGATLRLIGDGPERARLEALYPEMRFMGRLDPAAIGAWVAQARALIMPSRYPEPFGLVAVEALWSGVPVILPDSALLAPEIVAADAGLACDMRDTAATAAAMRVLLDDPAAARRMGRNGADRTARLASTPEAWLAELLALYEERLA